MEQLAAALKVALGNTFVMYSKAHSYHWNVEGTNFPQFHEFFGDLYEEVYGAVDPIAEAIRTLNVYAPISVTDIISASSIEEDNMKPADLRVMLNNLLAANGEVLNALNRALQAATQANKQGIVNFLAGRIEIHDKHNWMLTASLKSVGA